MKKRPRIIHKLLIAQSVFFLAITVANHTLAKGLLKLLADLIINVTYGDDTTCYWQNSIIKWHHWVSQSICTPWDCNYYFCRGRGTLKGICFTDVQNMNRFIGIVHIMKEKGSMTISLVYH